MSHSGSSKTHLTHRKNPVSYNTRTRVGFHTVQRRFFLRIDRFCTIVTTQRAVCQYLLPMKNVRRCIAFFFHFMKFICTRKSGTRFVKTFCNYLQATSYIQFTETINSICRQSFRVFSLRQNYMKKTPNSSLTLLFIYLITDKNLDDTMTLHWWMHWFWVTAQIAGKFCICAHCVLFVKNRMINIVFRCRDKKKNKNDFVKKKKKLGRKKSTL